MHSEFEPRGLKGHVRVYCRKAGLELPATRPVLSAQPELKAFSEFNQITAC